jgi:predicted YcjX-like family ATPase
VWIDFRTKWLRELVTPSTNGVFTVATNAGHYIQVDNPALVLSTIRRIVDAAR